MSSHGGSRKGAGRPKGTVTSEVTKLVRVPIGAESMVKFLIYLYKSKSLSIESLVTSYFHRLDIEIPDKD